MSIKKTIGVKIETFVLEGKYQHNILVTKDSDQTNKISREVIEALKQINEKIYCQMPPNSGDLTTRVDYIISKIITD